MLTLLCHQLSYEYCVENVNRFNYLKFQNLIKRLLQYLLCRIQLFQMLFIKCDTINATEMIGTELLNQTMSGYFCSYNIIQNNIGAYNQQFELKYIENSFANVTRL